MKDKPDFVPMLTRAKLKAEHGWTDKLIKEFLPKEPDLVRPNPNYKAGPPMLLFKKERIKEIERTESFKERLAGTATSKAAAKKAVETKLGRLRKYLEGVNISVPVLPREKLIGQACRHYNDMQFDREMEGRSTSGMEADKDSDTIFLARICVNYLRHCLTSYERHLDGMSGKVGFAEGYFEIRKKIFSEISKRYDWLAKECARQENGGNPQPYL